MYWPEGFYITKFHNVYDAFWQIEHDRKAGKITCHGQVVYERDGQLWILGMNGPDNLEDKYGLVYAPP